VNGIGRPLPVPFGVLDSVTTDEENAMDALGETIKLPVPFGLTIDTGEFPIP
jgi:hypothetical protein